VGTASGSASVARASVLLSLVGWLARYGPRPVLGGRLYFFLSVRQFDALRGGISLNIGIRPPAAARWAMKLCGSVSAVAASFNPCVP